MRFNILYKKTYLSKDLPAELKQVLIWQKKPMKTIRTLVQMTFKM